LKIWLIFFITVLFCAHFTVKFTSHLLSDEIILAVREWEREGTGITNGNGKGMGIKLG